MCEKTKVMKIKICSHCHLYQSLDNKRGWCSLKESYRGANEMCCLVDSMMTLAIIRERKFCCRFLNQVGATEAAMVIENGLHYNNMSSEEGEQDGIEEEDKEFTFSY